MKKSGIYRILNTENGKCYVGSATNLQKRKSEHFRRLRGGIHVNARLQSSWNKHGEMAFEFSILELVDDHTLLVEREQFWIDTLESVVRGYNISPKAGSQLGMKHTKEARAKIAAWGLNMPAETRAKISAAGKGRPWTAAMREKRTGWKHTDEAKAKMSAAIKAYNATHERSPETIARVCAARRNRPPMTEETKAKMRASHANRPPISPETRAKRSESLLRFYAEKNGVPYEVYSLQPRRDHHRRLAA
jgi:group I intron endonuclease